MARRHTKHFMTRQKVHFVILQVFAAMIVRILVFSVWEFVALEMVNNVT
jgi:hypothetical protein